MAHEPFVNGATDGEVVSRDEVSEAECNGEQMIQI